MKGQEELHIQKHLHGKYKNISKKGSVVFNTLLFFLWGSAQTESDLSDEAYITPYQYIKISASPVLYDNLRINEFGDTKLLKSYPVLSGGLTASYCYKLNKKYYLNIGVGVDFVPFNAHYYFKAPENSIFLKDWEGKEDRYLDLNHYEHVQSMWTFPFSIQKQIKRERGNKRYTWEVGLKYNYVVAYPYEISTGHSFQFNDTDSSDVKLFELKLFDTQRNLFSGFFKVGLINYYKSQRALHLNVVLQFSPMKMGVGSYEFFNLPFSSTGQIAQGLNYFGFECAFSFPLNKVYTPDQ